MDRKKNAISVVFSELIVLAFVFLVIRMNGRNLFWYYNQGIPLICTMMGVFVMLLASGLFHSFIKAFMLITKTRIEIPEGRKARNALLCAMISAPVSNILVTIAGTVASENGKILSEIDLYTNSNLRAICIASSIYGIILILLLIPVYFRIKSLIEESDK